ncbi:iron ABC transporter permease [Streptococcus sp. 121]|uniref:FecCD family ABC transporter permease n=1 Tax=Streptococcus sp. 121 TaxID=2797637 RepID=UPI0018F0FC5E|nr:iron ABC transporter permease [Streptococcus sp. 121]MBJ6745074.1 iron ABC transporter permease [Streptococcus sp. 121]
MKATLTGIPQNKPRFFWLVFCSLALLILGQVLLNLSWGQPWYDFETVLQVLLHPQQQDQSSLIVWDIRLPRALAALLVGASLAVSGAIMQGLTRNPIADPGLLGINAGAGLALAGGYAFLGALHYSQILLLCLLGAGMATALVLGLSYRRGRGLEPTSLILAGAMVASLFTALGQGLILAFNLSTALIGWLAGGLAATNWQMLAVIAPPILLGLFLAHILAYQLTIFSLNEEVAQGLGQDTAWFRLVLLLVVLLLSAAAVALVGSLALVGLIIPHLLRHWVGHSYSLLLPLAAMTGASFLLLCDLLAILLPGTPLNALISLLLLPIFLILMRKGQLYEPT